MNNRIRMYRGLNRNQLKYIAIFAMLCDHVAAYILQPYIDGNIGLTVLYYVMRLIGRLTAPVMSFFLVQGFMYTRNRQNYLIRLGIFALIAQAPYALLTHGTVWALDFNFLFTLLLGFSILMIYEQVYHPVIRWLSVLVLTFLSNWCDWGIWAVLWIMAFYFFRNSRKYTIYAFAGVTVFRVIYLLFEYLIRYGIFNFSYLYQLGALLFIPFLFLYNGMSGSKKPFHKWFFYVFYPLHLLIIYLLVAFVI